MLAAAITGAGSQPTSSPAPHQEWGLVNVACASLRAEPRHGAELETQATLGTPVRLDTICSGEWSIATLPDGYRAWMHTSAICTLTDNEAESWRKGKRVIVTNPYGVTVCSDTLSSPWDSAVTDATLGAIFCGTITPGSRFCEVKLPDGRTGYLPTASVDDFASWSERPMNVDGIIRTARSMNGVTYLWGGTTPKALDCSGFTQVCYRNSGTLLPRNASSQANICEPVSSDTPADWATGDLLFSVRTRHHTHHACGHLYRFRTLHPLQRDGDDQQHKPSRLTLSAPACTCSAPNQPQLQSFIESSVVFLNVTTLLPNFALHL